MSRKIFRIFAWGGLGDAMLLTPALKAIKETHKNCRIDIFIEKEQKREIYENNPFVDNIRRFSFFSNPVTFIRVSLGWTHLHVLKYGRLSPSYNHKRHAMGILADMLGVKLTDRRVQIYLTEQEDIAAKKILSPYRNVIAVHASPKCSDNKAWRWENWAELVRCMPQYTFVQLGLAGDDRIEGAVDLRGKTGFRESMAVIKHSMGFVGVDSSLAHSTNAFSIRGVVLFGPSSPLVWGHDNNINIWKHTRCAPCIDELMHHACPYGKLCMESISVPEVKAALLSHLGVALEDKVIYGS